jgi:hypothetical protein
MEDWCVDWKLLLRRIGNKAWVCGLDSAGSEYGPMAGSCEHDNETSASMKGGEFLDGQVGYLLKRDSAPCS